MVYGGSISHIDVDSRENCPQWADNLWYRPSNATLTADGPESELLPCGLKIRQRLPRPSMEVFVKTEGDFV